MICGKLGKPSSRRRAPPWTPGALRSCRTRRSSGNLLFLSGRAAVDPATGDLRADDFDGQLAIVLEDVARRPRCRRLGTGACPSRRVLAGRPGRLRAPGTRLLGGVPAATARPHDPHRGLPGRRAADRAAAHRAGAVVSGPKSVVVVGGGVAGLCSAYYLRQAGVDVTVVESNRIGSGASWGNGGWVCPAQAGPLPEPGLTWYGIRSLFDRDSALYFQLSQVPGARALAPALLDLLQQARPRARRRGAGRARPRRLRPRRRDARGRRRVRAPPGRHGRGRARAGDSSRRAGEAAADARLRIRPPRRRPPGGGAARARAGARRGGRRRLRGDSALARPPRLLHGGTRRRRCAEWTSRSSRVPRSPTS